MEKYTDVFKIIENIPLELLLNNLLEMSVYEFSVVLIDQSVESNVSLLYLLETFKISIYNQLANLKELSFGSNRFKKYKVAFFSLSNSSWYGGHTSFANRMRH